MSEKQKLIEKVIQLEYEISEIKQNMASKGFLKIKSFLKS